METIKAHYPVKPKSIGLPKVYLGVNIQCWQSNTANKQCWGVSSEQYVKWVLKTLTDTSQQVLHIFNYLDIHKANFVAFDPTPLAMEETLNCMDSTESRAKIMKEHYPDVKACTPPNAPEPSGNSVQINCFLNSNHVGKAVTTRSYLGSYTGILIFMNMTLVLWYSKHQHTAKSSTYSSEFTALKTATDQIVTLQYS